MLDMSSPDCKECKSYKWFILFICNTWSFIFFYPVQIFYFVKRVQISPFFILLFEKALMWLAMIISNSFNYK